MRSFLLIINLITFIFSANILFSQTPEQKKWLQNFSDVKTIEWQQNRAFAESLATIKGLPIRKEYEDGSVIELQSYENGVFQYHATENLIAAKSISTDKVWIDPLNSFSLSGNEQILGLWEAGGIPRITHQELIGRLTSRDNATTVTQHATHVAGTMIAKGIEPSAKGMSNNGKIDYYDSNNDLSETSIAAAGGLKVSNQSYGLIRGWRIDGSSWSWRGDINISPDEDYRFGFYDNTSHDWDNFLYNAPNILICKSAGNDRLEGPSSQPVSHSHSAGGSFTCIHKLDGGPTGYDCINDPKGTAKNTFTIGAVNDLPNGYNGPASVMMSSFSNWGPTDDGRIKPDIVANGVNLYSSDNASNTSYASLSGTSMSAPNISGSVGLLLELQELLYGKGSAIRSSTMKGLIIHNADEAGLNPGPDYIFGWGLMNTHKSAQIMRLASEVGGDTLIKETTISQGNQIQFQVNSNGSEPLRATICWIDPPATPPPASLNPPNLMLVNDLDLRIIGPGSTTYTPWVLNPSNPASAATNGDNFRDNVEQIHIESPPPGSYTVRVTHKGNLTNGLQNFSIILSGISTSTPGNPTLVSPSSDSVGVRTDHRFTWNHTLRALSYNIQISSDSSFNTLFINKDSISTTNFYMQNLNGFTKYYWRVRAKNSGGYGSWSTKRSFTTTIAQPLAPILVFPGPDQSKLPLSFNFIWNKGANAYTYRLQVANNTIFTSLVLNDSTISDTTFLINNLGDGKRYFWRVNSKNPVGTSAYSPTRTFFTALNPPDSLVASVLQSKHVLLTWKDKSANESKYYILRKIPSGNYSIIDSLSANIATYTDTTVIYGNSYIYRVFCINSFATSDSSNEASITVVSVKQELNDIPNVFSLFQNYPNPFNPVTSLSYALPVESMVSLKIFNLLGQEVKTLVNETQNAGYKSVEWNSTDNHGNHVVSGLYLMKFDATDINNRENTFTQVRKMILVR